GRPAYHEYNIWNSVIEWPVVCVSQLIGFVIPSMIFLSLDVLQPVWAQPWQKPAQFPQPGKLAMMARCSTKNMLTGWTVHGIYLWEVYPKTVFVVDSRLPTWKEATRQYIGVFVLGEGLFYVLHRLMHGNRWLYAKVYSVHHETGVAPRGCRCGMRILWITLCSMGCRWLW
ncbi:hypothetical protein BO71DRAFT_460095, partial [Aspergillus ellipticus CBS 707.79]